MPRTLRHPPSPALRAGAGVPPTRYSGDGAWGDEDEEWPPETGYGGW